MPRCVSREPWWGGRACSPVPGEAAGGWVVVELDASGSAFGKQFKRADRSGARWALVLGDEEVERGEVRLKLLQQQVRSHSCAVESAQSWRH